ncbi:Glutamyl-tRNA(Gln) amidotransferase subunit B, mitochondrial [Trichinella pseudospiralis]|uniref:Glutamyl-tRNA(Gln) amidotransferase subunit B, mitochondrial n=1 Tax=Trichinella pseudospiralis TaxID=6337 RepID=A0A0V1EWB8_TRIPS|nr:Glutamyl-tRNA(Gln) amidotransferase subunit B, mitochondrial [Trichinella pseudospiralis]KRZ44922.1 Glutamyl-tRNA(Gln) amidotransferase subunit B, mitochondrial [Trichinella pseudospiralis]
MLFYKRNILSSCIRCILKDKKQLYKSGSSVIDVEKQSDWEALIGLEIHAQINSKTKLFSNSICDSEAPANTLVSPFDMAAPGTMPVLNRRCAEAAVLTGLALNCSISRCSTFDRKHYFYPDMPAGYQITQYFQPIAKDGYVEFYVKNHDKENNDLYRKRVNILRLQLEQDSGKLFSNETNDCIYVDLNRCGIGLMEIVTDCTLKNGAEAAALVKELQIMMKALDTCRGRMERGEFRVDVNVSVRKRGEKSLRVRTELKNLISFHFISKAIDLEIARQIELYEQGGEVINETRSYDNRAGKTIPMRDKEVHQDYRYMPEPNLPPLLVISNEEEAEGQISQTHFVNIDKLKSALLLLPNVLRDKWIEVDKLPLSLACFIYDEAVLRSYYIECVDVRRLDPVTVANILKTELPLALKTKRMDIKRCKIPAKIMSSLVEIRMLDQISSKNFSLVIDMLLNEDPRSPEQIVQDLQLTNIDDDQEIVKVCEAVLKNETEAVMKFKNGKSKILSRFLRLASVQLRHRTSPEKLENIFLQLLNTSRPKDENTKHPT